MAAPSKNTVNVCRSVIPDRCPTINEIRDEFDEGKRLLDRLGRVFVIGCAKSGTTWVRNLLHGHPEIVIYGEGCFAWRLLPFLSQAVSAFNEHQNNGQPEITKFRERDFLLAARLMIDNVFLRYLEASGKNPTSLTYVGDKTPQHTIGIEILNTLYPQSKFIHIYRDPRDVATSAWFHQGIRDARRSFEQFIHHYMNEVWPLQVGTARRCGALLPADRYLELRFEDLIESECRGIRTMLRFLGVDHGESAVEGCREAGSFRNQTGGRDRGQGDNQEFYRKGVAGDWKNHLPRPLVSRLCVPIAELMQVCGYDPDERATHTVEAGRSCA